MSDNRRIALVGAGHMGSALAAGWLRGKSGLDPARLLVADPDPGEAGKALIADNALKHVAKIGPRMAKDIGLIVLAFKPQHFDAAAQQLAEILPEDCAVVSIIAGVSLRQMQDVFGDRPLIRAMPNTPASIGKGITVAITSEAGETRKADAEKLLKVGGPVEWIDDERLMGAVTAVSGSGPAYVFLLAEALAGAGFGEGLPRELADRLARETIIGAAALLQKTGDDPQTLRRAVTSPGGTTQAAIDVMMAGGGLPELMRRAINAAERRSRQLGNGGGR